jgi:mannan endo-1,4-beta-mannosidase
MNRTIILLAASALLFGCAGQSTVADRQPIDPHATPETHTLYNRLWTLLDSGTMLGHQDDLAYGHSWNNEPGRSDVKDMTGQYPAVVGFELGHLELGAAYNLDSVSFTDMKRYVREHHSRGGITTFSWHGDNILTGGTAWDCAGQDVVRSILPDGENHDKFLVWLDHLAAFFLDLKDSNGAPIPVIFRMYHEHTGDWFWWCAKQCTPDEYKNLWTMTLVYLRDVKGVHNLLYAYSPSETTDEAHYTERYPGDDYVDVMGFDCYASSDNLPRYIEAMKLNLSILTACATKSNKLPALTETGLEGIPIPTYFTEAVFPSLGNHKLSYILFWRNACDRPTHHYVPFVGHPAAADFVEFCGKDGIRMLKQ